MIRESALCAWFTLVGFLFWGPYGSLSRPDILWVGTALYGVFLLASVATLLLRVLRARTANRHAVDRHAASRHEGEARG